MLSSIKSIFKRIPIKNSETKKYPSSFLFLFWLVILEDVLFWKKWWLTLLFYFCYVIIFIVCVYQQLNLLQFLLGISIISLSIDAFEAWLKFKHRTTCLKRLTTQDISKLVTIATEVNNWIEKKTVDFLYLRDRNHTKAFLLLQIIFSITFLIGKYINGYMLTYTLCTLLLCLNKLVPHFLKIVKKVQQSAESDVELEGLMPDESDENLDLLSIEPEKKLKKDDQQSLDFWKPDDLPLEETSDSSDNSSSLVTNLSIDKIQTLTNEVEITDSSEDEYMPKENQPEQIPSSLEVQPIGTWSNTAYNMISNVSGAMINMVYRSQSDKKRKRVSSVDSSDGFEIVDKSDVI